VSEPLDIETYPVASRYSVDDMTPIERAWAEAEHEGCDEDPVGHALSEHSPWTGADLDGVETWRSFMARLARHGLTLVLVKAGRTHEHEWEDAPEDEDLWYCPGCGRVETRDGELIREDGADR